MAKNNRVSAGQNIATFEVKVAALKKFVFNDPYLTNKISDYTYDTLLNQVVVFLSVCDGDSRAVVYNGTGDNINDAWANAAKKVSRYITENNYKALWLKADVVTDCEIVPYSRFKNEISVEREFFLKKGVSFDAAFKTALLEAQLNCCGLINYKRKVLSLRRLREYYKAHDIDCFNVIPKNVITFSCTGYICDSDKSLHKLYPDKENYGRRVIRNMTADTIKDVISTSSVFLSNMVKENGQFVYGINPVNNDYFTTYNILRHTGTIWSVIMQYDTTKDEKLIPKIDKTIEFMLGEIEYRDENTACLVERKSNEIKLGGNAVAIITLCTYMEVFGCDKYKELVRKIANSIVECQEPDGSYYHILSFPDFQRKERDRIVYYDGEATFALAKAYGVIGDERYLHCAKKALDYFIANDYTKFRDHWIAYSINEVTQYNPAEKYLNFGLKNANVNLNQIFFQDTTFHTFLELLMATFDLYQRVKNEHMKASYLDKFDFEKFIKTIFRRAHYMLNGYLYPEFAMYMESPKTVVNTFCVRHDSYRIRIDDIQHYIGGYYRFYKHFDELNQYLTQISNEPVIWQDENVENPDKDAEERMFKAWLAENI